MTFLSYGTTARSARFFGAGDRAAAVGEGVQATWLALGLGTLIVVAVQAVAVPLVSALAAGGDIAEEAALPWVRIAILGVPGDPDLGGRQRLDARRAGHRPAAALRRRRVRGVGRAVPAAGVRLARHAAAGAGRIGGRQPGRAVAGRADVLPRAAGRTGAAADPAAVLRAQVVMGRDLVLRTLAFQACFVSAGAVAARFGAAAVAAHQVVLQLWSFLALVLDSLAIAAQSLVGAALGAGSWRTPSPSRGG